MKVHFTAALIVVLTLCAASIARAGSTGIFVEPNKNATDLGYNSELVREQVGAAIESELHVGDQIEFLSAMADANSIGSAGIGVDYVSNPDVFVVGVSLGNGFKETLSKSSEGSVTDGLLPKDGVVFHTSMMVGFNLASVVDDDRFASRLTLFLNGAQAGVPTPDPSYHSRSTQLGAHLQLSAVKPIKGFWLEWGGVDITSGVRAASYRMKMNSEIPIDARAGDFTLTWRATGRYDVNSYSMTIPFEVSTNARLGPVAFFVGTGVDTSIVNVSTSDAELSGNIVGKLVGDTEEVHLGTASVGINNESKGSLFDLRVFGGPQLSVGAAKVYGHANYSILGGVGGHVGLRLSH